jgi:hypothetical protein
MAQSPQEIYDAMKILNGTVKDKKDEIKKLEMADPKISAAMDAADDLKEQLKAIKKEEKAAREMFKTRNPSIYNSLDGLKSQVE